MRRLTQVALALVVPLAACGERSEGSAPPLASSATADVEAAASVEASASAASAAPADAPDEVPNAPPGAAFVGLDGVTHLPPPVPADRPRLAARAMLVPVRRAPDAAARVIGWLRAGAIVEHDGVEHAGSGCRAGYRGVRPTGFVCMDDATTDLDDPIVKATARRPDLSQSLPYMYGTVTRGGPVYARLPTEADLREHEPNLRAHLDKWRQDETSGASYGLELWFKWKEPKPSYTAWEALEEKLTDPDLPPYLAGGGTVPDLSGLVKKAGGSIKIDQIDRRQGAAFLDSFLHEGRRYAVTTDLRVVPADRYRPIKGSTHVGVRIGVDVELPFAFVRKPGGKRWAIDDRGKRTEVGSLTYREAIALTGKQKFSGGRLHYETKDGTYVDDQHASRIDPAKRMPKWGTNGEKWLDVNITKQVLVAYDGTRPVYATLVSTGEDGLKEGGRATLKGIFRVHTKYVSTTMDSDAVGEEFELRDVPYVQYFEGGYALHGAYWHDKFGTPKSHGCINLAPEDARRLFHFTEPQVPAHWHGAARPLTGTVLFVHP